jgi:hypothetical protein
MKLESSVPPVKLTNLLKDKPQTSEFFSRNSKNRRSGNKLKLTKSPISNKSAARFFGNIKGQRSSFQNAIKKGKKLAMDEFEH